MKKIKSLLILAVACALGFQAQAQNTLTPFILNSCNQTYTEYFNTLSTGPGGTPISGVTGWHSLNPNFRGADNGSLVSWGPRNYCSVNSMDYSLGSFNDNGTNLIGLVLQNNTGAPITSFTITYTGEQWRRGDNGLNPNKLTFEYRTSDISANNPRYINAIGNALTGTLTALDFTAPQNAPGGLCGAQNNGIALDGNLSANRRTMTGTITLATPLGVGDQILLRWRDINYNCADHGLSIDDVKITFTTSSPTPGTIVSTKNVCEGATYQFQINGVIGAVTVTLPDGTSSTLNPIGNTNIFNYTVPNGVTSFTIKNTLPQNNCFGQTSSSFVVSVVPAPSTPLGTEIDFYLPRACNTLYLELTGHVGDVIRWEYSTDGGNLWSPISNNTPFLSYTITTGTVFRAIVSRANATCQQLPVQSASYSLIDAPILSTPITSRDCAASTIEVSEVMGNTGIFTISPNPRNVPPQQTSTAFYSNLPAGTYTITYTAANGCTASRTVTVGSNNLAAPEFLPNPYAQSRTSINPEWIRYNGASSYDLQYVTPTGQTFTISGITGVRRNVTGLTCGTTYQFRVRARCSTGAISPYSPYKPYSTIACLREGSDLSSNTDFTLYPNPNNGNFSLTFEGVSGADGQVSVLDLNGKTIANQSFTATEGENTIRMNLEGVTSGIYLVRFQAGDVVKTQKIVVE